MPKRRQKRPWRGQFLGGERGLMFCWPRVLLQSLQMTNLTQILFLHLFIPVLYMFFSKQVLIIRTVNCINTTSGIYRYAGLDGTRGRINTIDCPDDEHLVVRNM